MKLLVIDNYDSFVYNLVALIRETTKAPLTVVKNDQVDLETLHQYSHILLSPGPGIPSEAGKMMEVLERVAPHTSVLGVCLGHQAIAEFSGARLQQLNAPLHGVTSTLVQIQTDSLFETTPKTFQIGHYHSWVVAEDSVPNSLEVLAFDEHHNIMAIKHKGFPWRGVQFHPESILTEHGKTLISNWIKN